MKNIFIERNFRKIFFKNFYNKGFTLVELMIVIAIIGILAAVLYPSVTGYFARARDTAKKAELRQIDLAIQTYYGDNGTYIIKGAGWKNLGQGWFNAKHESEEYHKLYGYKKTHVEILEEGGYLKKGSVKIYVDRFGYSKKYCKPYPKCKPYYNYRSGKDSYGIGVHLEKPTEKDKENFEKLLHYKELKGDKYSIINYGIGN